MNTTTTAQKPKAMRTLLIAAGLLGSGLLLLSSPGPAQADPPRHAPAHGYRRKQDKRDWQERRRDDRRDNRWDRRDWDRDRNRDRDRDGIPDFRERFFNRNLQDNDRNRRDNDAWRRTDSDRDGVPNNRDRYPNDRRRR